jgi:protocatechuate 3,4-dioxygenase beta subunit
MSALNLRFRWSPRRAPASIASLVMYGWLSSTASAADDDPSKAVIRGVVVDESGAPVGGAVVSIPAAVFRDGPEPATSAGDGAFRLVLSAPAVQYTTLLARSADGALQGLVEFHESDDALTDVRVVLKPVRTMAVQVVDADGGPVAGAQVGVVAHYHPIGTGVAGPDGTVTLSVPADAEVDWVFGFQPALGFDYFENYHAFPTWGRPIPPESIELTLGGTRSVEVKVVDGQNRPVAGVAVMPWSIQTPGKLSYANLSGEPLTSVLTDVTGIAHFDWIPTEIENGVTFLVHHADYHCPNPPNLLSEDRDKQLIATVYRNGRISGRVTHADGTPAAGILLQAEGRGATSHYFRGRARTDRDGKYELAVYPDQTYIVAVIDREWAAKSFVGFHIAEGMQQQQLDFVLDRGTVIRGTATLGSDAQPAAGETVTVIQQSTPNPNDGGGSSQVDLVRWAKTDESGQYEIRIGPGTYRLQLPNAEQWETLTVPETEGEVIVRDAHAPRKARGELAGTIVDPAGEPLVNAEVYGESIASAGHAGFNTVTRDGGKFVTDRWRDEMVLYARSADGALAGAVEIGPDADSADLTLQPAGSIIGRVVDADGQPLAGVRVTCGVDPGPTGVRGSIHLNTRTDPRGIFEFRGLAVGIVVATGAYYGPQFEYASGPRATIERAEEVDVGAIRVNVILQE